MSDEPPEPSRGFVYVRPASNECSDLHLRRLLCREEGMRCRNPSRRDHDDAVAQAEMGVGPEGPGRMMDHAVFLTVQSDQS
jgi:hypothetical protein